MKFTYIKTIVAVILTIVETSCSEYLDVVPDNSTVIEDTFKDKDSAEQFLATLYGYLPSFNDVHQNPALASGDEIAVNDNVSKNWASRTIARGGQSKIKPKLGYWGTDSVKNLFIALRDCNIFLNNIDLVNIHGTKKGRMVAEAKFLKAYYHFYLMRMYGPIPIVRKNIKVGAGIDAAKVSREPVDKVADYIVKLLDEAIVDLPNVIQDKSSELGRITAPIAAAIKARVLVTVASPLFNGNSDYANFTDKDGNELINTTFDIEKWVKATEACKTAINLSEEAGHSLYLYDKAPDNWSKATVTKLSIRGSITERWNPEIIWGDSRSTISDLQKWSQVKIGPNQSVGSYWSPPLLIAEMFYSKNGIPIDEDKNYDYMNRFDVATADNTHKHYVKSGFSTAKLNLNREARFYASLGFDGGIWLGQGVINDDNALVVRAKKGEQAGILDASRWSLSGYFAKKLVYYKNFTAYPFPLVRLADLYLLYAEALNESGQTNEAQLWIDKVRERADLKGVVESWAVASNNPTKPSSKEGLRDIIQDERMIELVFEGHRFWDIRRWKRATEFLNRDIRAWNVEGKSTQSYYDVIIVGKYKFSDRDYLWPISETDMVANNKLIQNPGW